jgi:hypothetical protein
MHFFTLEDSTRILSVTSGTEGSMSDGGTVSGGETTEVPPLHSTLKPLTLIPSTHINKLPWGEVSRTEHVPHRQQTVWRHLELMQLLLRWHTRLHVMSNLWLQ